MATVAMTLAEQADAATTRDALAAIGRLCADLRDFQPELTPEPTLSATRPQEADQ